MKKINFLTYVLPAINKISSPLLLVVFFLIAVCNLTAQQNTSPPVPGTVESLTQKPNARAGGQAEIAAVTALQQFYSSTGHYTLSADGIGSVSTSMNIRVNKPNAQATVQKAILLSSVTANTIANGCVGIAGVPVTWNGNATSTVSSTFFFNSYWADVTSILAPVINAFPAGLSNIPVTECNTLSIDGEALLVVFNDATATEKTIIVMVGALNTAGDNFSVTLAQPIDPSQPGALLNMGLGIGFGFQQNGGPQISQVSVNGQRLTSSAGGEDDGASANGALLTVGGIGDLNTNPANPLAAPTNPRSDDELYNILPFINSSTTSLNINTINPSNDDNIFLAYFALSGAAIIGEGILLSQTTSSGTVGTSHTVKAAVLNSLGQAVANRQVNFAITSGPNAGNTFSTNTNASGEAFYTYTGSGGAGTDNIQACFTNSQSAVSCSNTLQFLWTAVISNDYYSKPTGDLHNVLSWGVNPDGSGANPPDFTAGKTFHLVNRVPLYTLTANWTVGGKLDIPTGSTLSIAGNTLSIADLIGTGNLKGSLTSSLVVTGTAGGDPGPLNFTSDGGSLNNFTLDRTGASATASIGTALGIYGVLTLTNGALNTGNNITLKSNVVSTARVAPVTGSISGNVIVERYIPARRAWRIMSAPVGGMQTINQAWQEGATTSSANPNPSPGFGTHITEGSAADGYDHNPYTAMISVKKYASASDAWVTLPNTISTSVSSEAYLLFVRGDRSVALGYNNVAPNITTLRVTGPLKTGDQLFPVAAAGFTAVPNPFASPINFATITRNNVQNNFYLWDPKAGGASGNGGYVLLSFNGSGYDISPAPVSPESQYIQSCQGFLVHSTGSAGSLTIKESDKSALGSADVFRVSGDAGAGSARTTTDPATKGLRATLQIVNDDKSTSVLDETLSSYGSSFFDIVDDMDAVKPSNIMENLGIAREDKILMIERRHELSGNDTIRLKLWNLVQKDYTLQLTPANLSSSAIRAGYLEDRYLHTFTTISLSEPTKVSFTVDANPASSGADRFVIVLSSGKLTVPATIITAGSKIKLSPNPVTGNTVAVQFIDQPKGTYNIVMINSLGQTLFERSIKHEGGSATQTLQLNNNMLNGLYRMRVTNSQVGNNYTIPVLMLKK